MADGKDEGSEVLLRITSQVSPRPPTMYSSERSPGPIGDGDGEGPGAGAAPSRAGSKPTPVAMRGVNSTEGTCSPSM